MHITRWAEEMRQKYKRGISNAFIITGNITDYAWQNIMVPDYLEELLVKEFRVKELAFYDLSAGSNYRLRLPNPVKVETDYGAREVQPGIDGEDWRTMCQKLMDTSVRRAFIVTYPEFIIPPEGRYLTEADKSRVIDLHKTITSAGFINSSNILVFLTDSSKNINNMFLNTNTSLIEIKLPDYEERLSFIRFSLTEVEEYEEADAKHNRRIKRLKENMNISLNELAQLTAGLSLQNIEDVILMALDEGILSRQMIMERKKELINKEFGEIIELMDTTDYTLDKFAGLDHIKEYFREVVIQPIRSGDVSIVPKGVLLMGPPGTGKTYFSKCLAGDAGINFVEFKMSKILDKYVGEAEKNLEKALAVFRALAPVGVFIDEADQALQRGDQDSNSVNRNLFGMILSEMSKPENRGRIIWIGATNYPNKMDEALKRAGRFDKKIPFFAPSAEERREVFKIHLKNCSLKVSADIDLDVLVKKTEGYTQAEIETVAVKALELAKRAKAEELTQEKLELALSYMLSAQNDKIREMEDIALKECNDQEFIPRHYRERHKKLFCQRLNRP